MVRLGTAVGMTSAQSEVYAILFWVGEPMTWVELTEASAASGGSISKSLRYLHGIGLVHHIYTGAARPSYEAERDFGSVLDAVFMNIADPILRVARASGKEALAEVRGALDDGSVSIMEDWVQGINSISSAARVYVNTELQKKE